MIQPARVPRPPEDEQQPVCVEYPYDERGGLEAEIVMGQRGDETRLDMVTYWQPDEGECKALANGAPIIVRIEGPPLDPEIPSSRQVPAMPAHALQVGSPPDGAQPMLSYAHVIRLLAALFGTLAEPFPDSKGPGFLIQHYTLDGSPAATVLEANEFLAYAEDLIAKTRDAVGGPGDGASIQDIALPGHVRGDLG
jgi:hypothetical protein